MFYYYGRKKRIAALYPDPEHGVIVEPFAGSAAYSLHGDRWKKDVVLYDINPHVADVWRYLLSATSHDIDELPDRINDDLPIGAKKLIGFHFNPGSSQPKLTPTKFNRWAAGKSYISKNIHKVRHWRFFEKSYECINQDDLATWFIDPPYQGSAGRWYRYANINYSNLANWVNKLNGQIIVCDEPSATWLEFSPLENSSYASIGKRKLNEGIYIRASQ